MACPRHDRVDDRANISVDNKPLELQARLKGYRAVTKTIGPGDTEVELTLSKPVRSRGIRPAVVGALLSTICRLLKISFKIRLTSPLTNAPF